MTEVFAVAALHKPGREPPRKAGELDKKPFTPHHAHSRRRPANGTATNRIGDPPSVDSFGTRGTHIPRLARSGRS